MEVSEQIQIFQQFIEIHCLAELLETIRKGQNFFSVDFILLSKYSPEVAELLLEQPEEVLKACELAITNFDLPKEIKQFHIRFYNLPEQHKIYTRHIRSEHINKFLVIEGTIRQKSDVRPQVTSARFECPSCGNVMNVLQLDSKFKEPSRCGCGRKGKFRLLSKELIDVQGIVLEEVTKDLEGGAQPKRINVLLKQDLVSPMSDKKTNPGTSIQIVGILKEVPIILRSGGQSTKYDLLIEANNIIPLEEDYSTIEIKPEEREIIKKIADDPQVYKKLANSLAPGIYGHQKIKEALILQFVGGVKKLRDDGVMSRGDIHILLIGDPGAGKSQLLKRSAVVAPKARFVSGKGVSGAGLCVSPYSIVLTNPGGMETIQQVIEPRLTIPQEITKGVWKQEHITDVKIQSLSHNLKLHSQYPEAIWKLAAPPVVYELTLSSGKKIEITGNTQLLTIQNGKPLWKKSMDFATGEYIATPRKLCGGTITQQYIADLISSNPVVHDIKFFVKNVTTALAKRYGNVRNASVILKIPENNLYFNWVNTKARGNIELCSLRKICEAAEIPWKNHIETISLYNGKKHTIPVFLNEEFLYVAGLIAGDGDIRRSGKTYSIRFSNQREELHSYFKEVIQKQFTLLFDVQKGNEKRPTATRTQSKILAEILFSLGIPESPKSHKIALSNTLLHLTNNLLSHFIAGLYDTDGSVSHRKTHGSDCIEYTTCSETLARQLQLALLRYGIRTRIRTRAPSAGRIKGKYQKWIVEIRGIDQITQFAKEIPLNHLKKKEALGVLLQKCQKANTNVDVIPTLAEKAKELLLQQGLSLKKFKWRPTLSRTALQKLAHKASCHCRVFEDIWKIAQSDIYWERLISIQKKIPVYDYVYDLTVKDSHNFVVDGVLVHNTAAVVRDEFLSGWSLEAGAMVLANKGILMIDELDKMTDEDRSAMHEGMEQQTISISKANIQATLRCETTILAAANPKFGRFDPYEPIAKQINLPPALINRFDLIFSIKDLPDKEKDEELAHFILSLHKKHQTADVEVPTELLRKYLIYARQKIVPKLSEQALEELKEYYVRMRSSGFTEEKGIKAIPISARQLEALVRLAEASAKVRLSDTITRKDAKYAINLLHYCLEQVGMDPETGKIDIDRISTGITTSERTKILSVREIIHELEEKLHTKAVPLEEILKAAQERGLNEDKVMESLDKLKRSGDIFEPRKGFISRIQ